MLPEQLESPWLAAFASVLSRCGVRAGETVAVLSESQSRPVLARLARLASSSIGARLFSIEVPSPFEPGPPVRSTGACTALHGLDPVVAALAQATLVVDCTVEGLMHAPQLPAILKGGARVIYVSDEHPEALARLVPDDAIEPLVKDHIKRVRSAKAMHVTSAAGTDLSISLAGAACGGNWGSTT